MQTRTGVRLIYAAFFAVSLFAAQELVSAQENTNGPPKTEQQKLTEAQTRYYEAQAAKLDQDRSLSQRIINLSAFLAALVAVLSLVLNYSSTLRTQRDSQFLEALKRFGDKDSPTVRSSAAGLLAKLSNQKGIVFWWKRPNFDIALDQLMAGSLLEDNQVCLTSIKDALRQLTLYVPIKALEKIRQANLDVQKEMVESLAAFLATKPLDEDTGQPSEEHWNDAAAMTPYEVGVLSNLVDRHTQPPLSTRSPDIFDRVFKTKNHEYDTLDPAKQSDYAIAAQKALQLAGDRLNLNVEIFAMMLKTDPFRNIPLDLSGYPVTTVPAKTLESVFLVKGYLSLAKLQGVNLQYGQLQDTDLSRADLRASLLYKTNLQGANLERANLQKAFMVGAELGTLQAYRNTNLDDADLEGANLSAANLKWVSAKGANLKGAHLDGAQLYELEIDQRTNLDSSDWWKADFGLDEDIDVSCLAQLFDRYEYSVPDKIDELHQSVRKFLEKHPREIFNRQHKAEYLASS